MLQLISFLPYISQQHWNKHFILFQLIFVCCVLSRLNGLDSEIGQYFETIYLLSSQQATSSTDPTKDLKASML